MYVALKVYSIKGPHVRIPLYLSEGVYVTSFRIFVFEIVVQKEIFALLQYYIAYSGNTLPMFRDNLSVRSSRVKKSFISILQTQF
jgi:hypothetical protein